MRLDDLESKLREIFGLPAASTPTEVLRIAGEAGIKIAEVALPRATEGGEGDDDVECCGGS